MSRGEREKGEYELGSAREWTSASDAVGRTTLKVPSGVGMFAVKKPGIVRLDIIPYRVGKGNPDAAPGKLYWQRFYWMHRGVGPNQDSYCCPRMCSKGAQRCPV